MYTSSNSLNNPVSKPSSRLQSDLPSGMPLYKNDISWRVTTGSRPLARVPSTASVINDESRPIPRIESIASIWERDLDANERSPAIANTKPVHRLIFSYTSTANRDALPDIKTAEPLHKSPSMYPIGTGRPRKASMAKASKALNEAYYRDRPALAGNSNASNMLADSAHAMVSSSSEGDMTLDSGSGAKVLKCPIHGEGCDGETTTTLHQTEAMRRAGGFSGSYPMIRAKGRVMVDWRRVYLEMTGKSE